MSKLDNRRFWKLLSLAEIVDNLIPDYEPITVVRTAIVKKQSADSINLNYTKTSQEARKVEEQLAKDLEKEYKKIMVDKEQDFGVLQKRYGPEVQQIIRGAVQKLYLIGSDYATKSQNTTAFITNKDLDNIKRQVNGSYDAFWRRIYDAKHKKDITIIPIPFIPGKRTPEATPITTPPTSGAGPGEELILGEPNITADVALLSTVAATTTLALSLLSKLEQIPSEEKRKVIWVTKEDEKVCLICDALQGTEWDDGDPAIPIPGPDSSHFGCRCRILVKQGEDILSG